MPPNRDLESRLVYSCEGRAFAQSAAHLQTIDKGEARALWRGPLGCSGVPIRFSLRTGGAHVGWRPLVPALIFARTHSLPGLYRPAFASFTPWAITRRCLIHEAAHVRAGITVGRPHCMRWRLTYVNLLHEMDLEEDAQRLVEAFCCAHLMTPEDLREF